ncbi:MAG: hypothetical protein Q4B31_03490 [Clostridia bacterium]|nr:hypothetical protein [Clostridia bacterium]
MTKTKSTKRALVYSALSLLMCVAMLAGSTFAWFTDTDTVATSNIISGGLDVEIVGEDGNEISGQLVFKAADGRQGDSILWEPNATFHTQNFAIKNTDNLALKFKMEINNTEVSYSKLNEVIDFTFHWAKDDSEFDPSDLDNLKLVAGDSTDLMYIKGHMSKDAGNQYQNLTLSGVSITVYATQAEEEADYLDSTYDAESTYPGDVITVGTADEFITAFSTFKEGTTITLTADIDMAGKAWTPVSNKSFTLDGNNKTVKNLNGPLVLTAVTKSHTIKNVTFDAITIDDSGKEGYAALIAYADSCSYIMMDSVKITNATITSSNYAAGFVGYSSGYGNDTDGPVNASHNFTNCSISDSIIKSTGDGSVGGLIAHAGGSPATTTRISGFSYSNNTLSQTTTRTDKLGQVIGTAGCGIVYIDSLDTTTEIGRFAPQGTGKLVINGVDQEAFAN